MRLVATLLFVVLAACPLPAAAGVLIVEKTATEDRPPETHQVQIDRDWMRVEHQMSGEKAAFIFDGTRDVVRMVNYDRKTYSEMTRADVERLGGQMSAAMAQMQEAMKKMSPEQRAMVESMMKGRMPGADASAPRTVYKKVGTDTVGRWRCDRYEGFQNDQKTSEVCTVDPSVLGFVPADLEVTRKLAEFFKRMMPQNADSLFSLGKPEEEGFSGVPVRRVFSTAGRPFTTELVDVTRQTFTPSTWEVPAGFARKVYGER